MNKEKLAKIKKLALDYKAGEKGNASRILAREGVFVDIAGIEWSEEELLAFSKDKRLYLFGFEPLDIKQLTP